MKRFDTWTTSIPFTTLPNTVCLLSNHGVATVVIKNWEPLVFGPALAIESVNGLSCLKLQYDQESCHYKPIRDIHKRQCLSIKGSAFFDNKEIVYGKVITQL